jgi:hypothetical protein
VLTVSWFSYGAFVFVGYRITETRHSPPRHSGMLDSIPVDKITAWDAEFQEHLSSQQGPLLEEISKGVMTKELEEKSTS